MSLAARFGLRLGDLDLDADIDVADREVVALVGPNGAGKTTAVRAIAGLVPIDRGRIELDGRVLDDPNAGVFVPAAARGTAVVFQDHLLFGHLSALDNVAFGLRARGIGRGEARSRASAWLERVGLGDLSGARPAALSGGQAQRVALARALVTEPAVLLLDEALAGLDAATAGEVRGELRRHLRDRTGPTVVVTHDPVDAIVLADRLLVLDGGRIVEAGPVGEVARRPRTAYAAALLDVNVLRGTSAGDGTVQLASGAVVRLADRPSAGPVSVAVRPQAVAVHRHEPEGSAQNRWALRVAAVEPGRGRARVALAGAVELVAEVTEAAVAELGIEPGAQVWASVKAVDVTAYATGG